MKKIAAFALVAALTINSAQGKPVVKYYLATELPSNSLLDKILPISQLMV